eukprot:g30691.t1
MLNAAGLIVVVNEKDARVEVGEADGRPPSTPTLQFDQVFWDDQQELFARLQPALLSCIGGASCTVLAHGGPQSGKSYTLSGLFTSGETHGVAPRAIQAITEELERLTTPVPSVDASFFELQQDAVCDLLAAGAPRVAMRETTQPPFVALDQHLSAMRCDGASGFNRLLDAYFTGLEHRRKGHHTCFQVAFGAEWSLDMDSGLDICLDAGGSHSGSSSFPSGNSCASSHGVLQQLANGEERCASLTRTSLTGQWQHVNSPKHAVKD